MSFYAKWEVIAELFDSWKIQNASIFYFWKNSTKNGQIFNFLPSKGRHFSITKLDILIFSFTKLDILIYSIFKWVFEVSAEKG